MAEITPEPNEAPAGPVQASVPEPAPAPVPVPVPEKPAEEADGDAIQRVHEDIVAAMGKLGKVGKSVPNLTKHLQTDLYPLLARSVGLSGDLRDALGEALSMTGGIDPDDEYISEKNLDFLRGYIDEIVFPFVLKYSTWAADQPEFKQELQALYQGGVAVKKVLDDIEGEESDDE